MRAACAWWRQSVRGTAPSYMRRPPAAGDPPPVPGGGAPRHEMTLTTRGQRGGHWVAPGRPRPSKPPRAAAAAVPQSAIRRPGPRWRRLRAEGGGGAAPHGQTCSCKPGTSPERAHEAAAPPLDAARDAGRPCPWPDCRSVRQTPPRRRRPADGRSAGGRRLQQSTPLPARAAATAPRQRR